MEDKKEDEGLLPEDQPGMAAVIPRQREVQGVSGVTKERENLENFGLSENSFITMKKQIF